VCFHYESKGWPETGVFHVKIAMIGSGYVDLVSGGWISDFGHALVCASKDPALWV